MRASDIERQRTIDELRRHCAAGRLDVDEYALRIEKAMAATTLEELDHLRSDLPMMRIADPAGAAGGRVWARRALPGGRGAGSGRGDPPDRAVAARDRVTAVLLAVVSVLVVLAVLVLAVAAEWAWAAVLLAGWLIGLLQGRLSSSSRRRS